jgi:hypothetical protein
MKKNLNEQVGRIKTMMGLIMEQGVKIVSIQGKVPITSGRDNSGNIVDTTDWDGVHGILSSKKIKDTLEKRVSTELTNGSYRVTKVTVTASKSGNKIITDGSVELTPVTTNPHKIFATRGSIGDDYVNRHDEQVTSLKSRLKANYGGKVTTFGPYDINVVGTGVNFKQSFFASEVSNKLRGQMSGSPFEINITKPAISTELDGLYELNKKEFKSQPGRYLPSKFELVSDGKNMTYKLNVTPHDNGFPMLAFVVGDEALNNVFTKNGITNPEEQEDRILYTKNIKLLNPNNNRIENFKVMIVGF